MLSLPIVPSSHFLQNCKAVSHTILLFPEITSLSEPNFCVDVNKLGKQTIVNVFYVWLSCIKS
jgi:hypothetical protein